MKNKTKLILANLFALVSVVLILTGTKLLGIDLGYGSGAIIPKFLLIFTPQLGFIYLVLQSSRFKSKKVTA
ncbi:MAG: hypothetical protein WD426_20845 [Anditalea sp.]